MEALARRRRDASFLEAPPSTRKYLIIHCLYINVSTGRDECRWLVNRGASPAFVLAAIRRDSEAVVTHSVHQISEFGCRA